MVELRGQIERITYTNEENGYTVARVALEGNKGTATVVGTLHDPSPGTVLTMRGEWTTHPKFGSQFKLLEYETVEPTTTKAIESYLAAGAVKGIGPATAKQIVGKFGTQALKVMDEDIGRLREISGIGKKRVEQIRRSWEAQREVREVMLFLQGNGVSPAYAAKIVRRYGRTSISVVRRNPYRLATDIAGIGFATADRIASTLGYPRDAEQRLEAGLAYVLSKCTDEGHLYLPHAGLLRRSSELLGVDERLLRPALLGLLHRRRFAAELPVPAEASAAIELRDETPVYPRMLFENEVSVAKALLALAAPTRSYERGASPLVGTDPSLAPEAAGTLRGTEPRSGQLPVQLGSEQLAAVETALRNRVAVITGGPGTGKTTIIDALARLLTARGEAVALAAPTGRAARRMAEATGREARTIHRLLEVDLTGRGFQRTKENPLECEALILDEISMVDIPLMAALLDALPTGARLVMVGDADQLPSVGPGNLLADIIASKVVPVARLTEVYRQSHDSGIIAGAYDIIHGRLPEFAGDDTGDFYFIEQDDPERLVGLILALVRNRIPDRFGLDPFRDIQVLAPMNRGTAGTINLNAKLKEALNPGGVEIVRGGRHFRRGDRVMQTRNNYTLDVFNGDVGRITRVDAEAAELVVDFDGTNVSYVAEDLDELVHAYAVTVHKAQGSEFPAVVVPLLTQAYLLLQRNLLYTAVTRGKRLVVIAGSHRALSMAIRNDRTLKRNTRLAERLAHGVVE